MGLPSQAAVSFSSRYGREGIETTLCLDGKAHLLGRLSHDKDAQFVETGHGCYHHTAGEKVGRGDAVFTTYLVKKYVQY